MSHKLMRAARLHGIKDLQLEELPVPRPGPGELLVRVEACGICPTDARKYAIGVSGGEYPLNPGHEWVGLIEETGQQTGGWARGDRVYGDTYGGYAELALVPARPQGWSCGAIRMDPALPLERAVFLEPLADCLHAVHDQARVAAAGPGQSGLRRRTSPVAGQARVRVRRSRRRCHRTRGHRATIRRFPARSPR